jgi:spore photoproduct lyase
MERLVDVSVGSFRVSQDYLKKMRKNQPTSPVVQFPYQNDHGVYHYPDALLEEMETYLVGRLEEKLPLENIFRWNK